MPKPARPIGKQDILTGPNDMGVCVPANVAGGDNCIYNSCLNYDLPFSERYLELKSARTIFRLYGLKARNLDVLAILYIYQYLNEKLITGCTFQSVSNWSGFGYAWKRGFYLRMEENIANDLVERFPFNGGFRLLISEKGFRMLNAWQNVRDELIKSLEQQHLKGKAKAERVKHGNSLAGRGRMKDPKTGRILPGSTKNIPTGSQSVTE
jgi:hypothetical protein